MSAPDAFLRDLASLFRARQIYPPGNEQVTRAAERAARSLQAHPEGLRIAGFGDQVIVEDGVVANPPKGVSALLDTLRSRGCEGLRVAPGAGAQDLAGWIEALFGAQSLDLGTVTAGRFSFGLGSPDPDGGAATAAAAGYAGLLGGVQGSLSDLGKGRRQGLGMAQEIVRSVVAHLAVGQDLFLPVRELKGHDAYTFTHALNVAVLSSALGRALGLPSKILNSLTLAALCHDVGKERTPLEVLNKPGALDEEERRIMDRHTVDGARLLLALGEQFDPLLPVVAFQHHRSADGGGYPRTPDTGRPHPLSLLVSVADLFDAMRTVRPYRPARSAEEAFSVMLQVLARGGFLRQHVAAFVRMAGFLGPGAQVELSDGRRGRVSRRGRDDVLAPVVETDEGTLLDLASPDHYRRLQVRTLLRAPGAG